MSCPHRPHGTCAVCRACAGTARAMLVLGLTTTVPGCGLGTTAVYGAPVVDDDEDGYEEGWDCNDEDPSIHPEADDPEGDGIDQNCDGVDGIADTGA